LLKRKKPSDPNRLRPICLALQGGGSHGAFQWGVLDRLLEDGRLEIKAVTAASAGAMNGAALISGMAANGRDGAREALDKLWREMNQSGGRNVFGDSGVWNAMTNPGWLKETPFWRSFKAMAMSSSPYEFNPFNLNPLKRVLDASIDLFIAQTGAKPAGFRSPAWEMTPHMLAEIKRHGFYDSSLMGFDTPYSVDGITEVPVNWATDDAIFFKFLGGGGGIDMAPPRSTEDVLKAWTEEFEASYRYGTLFMLTVHDWISGRPVRVAMLELLLERIKAKGDVWIGTVAELAAHHRAVAPDRDVVESNIPETLFDHPAWKSN